MPRLSWATQSVAEAMPAFESGSRFNDILVGALENLLHAVETEPESWRLLLMPSTGAPPGVQNRFEAARIFALGRLEQLLAWGIEQHQELADLDQQLMALTLLATGEQAVTSVLNDPAQFTAERYARFARSLLKI